MSNPYSNSRWLFLREIACYAIGYYDEEHSAWRFIIPLCYVPQKLFEQSKEHINSYTIVIEGVMPADKFDFMKVIPGNPATIEVEHPHSAEFIAMDMPLREASVGKITINGQVIFGMTLFGALWTPARPDMGSADLYAGSAMGNLHKAVAANLFGSAEGGAE